MREDIENRLRLLTQAFGQLICLYPQNTDKETIEELRKSQRMFAMRTDREALSQDWHNVGKYIQTGMDRVKNA